MRLGMYYHRLNNLDELLNVDLTAKIGRGIIYRYLMDRECNCSIPLRSTASGSTEVNAGKNLIYEVKLSMYEAIYIGSNQQTLKKRMDGHFSDILHLLKSGQ